MLQYELAHELECDTCHLWMVSPSQNRIIILIQQKDSGLAQQRKTWNSKGKNVKSFAFFSGLISRICSGLRSVAKVSARLLDVALEVGRVRFGRD